MRRVHGKSIILGIGMGMIITAIASLIYSGGEESGTQAQKLSRDEVIRLARSYGMVESVYFIEDDSSAGTINADNDNKDSDKAIDTSAENTQAVAKDTKKTADGDQRNIIVEIKSGYDSNKVADVLFEKGVISDKSKFEAVMDSYNASDKINIGSFTFKKNEDYDYVVKTICNIKGP